MDLNNKDYLQIFRRRMYTNRVCNPSEAGTQEAKETFDDLIDNKLAPTVHTVPYVKRENVGKSTKDCDINVLVEDTSKNDQKLMMKNTLALNGIWMLIVEIYYFGMDYGG